MDAGTCIFEDIVHNECSRWVYAGHTLKKKKKSTMRRNIAESNIMDIVLN